MRKEIRKWRQSLAVILASMGIIFGSFACGSSPDPMGSGDAETSQVEGNAETLRAVYVENLEYLRDNHISFDDEDAVLNATLRFYEVKFGQDSSAYRSIAAAAVEFDGSSGMLQDYSWYSKNLQAIVERVDDARNQAPGLEQFLNQLQELQKDVLSSSWTNTDKTTSISYLILLEETMRYLGQDQGQQFSSSQFTAAAFSFWRCAAGVVGGAILGGLTGAAAGSVIPAIGTTAGGVWGAIGGGLTGAAAAC